MGNANHRCGGRCADPLSARDSADDRSGRRHTRAFETCATELAEAHGGRVATSASRAHEALRCRRSGDADDGRCRDRRGDALRSRLHDGGRTECARSRWRCGHDADERSAARCTETAALGVRLAALSARDAFRMFGFRFWSRREVEVRRRRTQMPCAGIDGRRTRVTQATGWRRLHRVRARDQAVAAFLAEPQVVGIFLTATVALHDTQGEPAAGSASRASFRAANGYQRGSGSRSAKVSSRATTWAKPNPRYRSARRCPAVSVQCRKRNGR